MFRDDFRDYAEHCFGEFGDRVKYWITLNEPSSYVKNGYINGKSPPGQCSSSKQLNCTGGDSGTEPYLVSYNLLLAHAFAVKVYKQKYQVPRLNCFMFFFLPFFLIENCTTFNNNLTPVRPM